MTLITILLILALIFCVVSFVASGPWHQVALLLVIVALLVPKFGMS